MWRTMLHFTMNGGTISNNKGINGAGVCVVDDNPAKGQTSNNTTFIMEGGTISKKYRRYRRRYLFSFQWSRTESRRNYR